MKIGFPSAVTVIALSSTNEELLCRVVSQCNSANIFIAIVLIGSSLSRLNFLNFSLVLDWFITSIHFTVVNPMPIIPPHQHFSLLELLRLLALLSTRSLKDLSTTSIVCLLEFYSFILIAVSFILCSRFIFLRHLSSCYV